MGIGEAREEDDYCNALHICDHVRTIVETSAVSAHHL